jgi:hypothetical protein
MPTDSLQTDVDRDIAAMITMHVRKRIDDFRARHLTDEQVGELTTIVRSAVLDMVVAMRLGTSDDEAVAERAQQFLAMTAALVPHGWQQNELGAELGTLLRPVS